mmetsp:Transcript_23925/g.56928  ORF Transcript_23925/g.56928 Transcript_23925/m.56928 type:complete len:88 (+) Transcript_23925:3-266(+)
MREGGEHILSKAEVAERTRHVGPRIEAEEQEPPERAPDYRRKRRSERELKRVTKAGRQEAERGEGAGARSDKVNYDKLSEALMEPGL